jgi:hypothetical protein
MKETILSTLVNGNVTESIIERVYYETRDNQLCKITKKIKRITTKTPTKMTPTMTDSSVPRNIKPFGQAAKPGVDNMLYTSYGEEVFITKPSMSDEHAIQAPLLLNTKELVNKQLKTTTTTTTTGSNKKTFSTFASKAMETKTVDDDEYTRTIFLDNIPDDADKASIVAFICNSGKVDNTTIKRVNIVFDKQTNKSQCKAFVVFNTAKIALKVVSAINGDRFGDYNIVSAQIAKPRKE